MEGAASVFENWWVAFIGVRAELDAIKSPQERARIWLEVEKRVERSRFVNPHITFAFVSAIAFGIARPLYDGLLTGVLGSWLSPRHGAATLGACLVLAVLLLWGRFLRQEYARALRGLLRERGIPVCMACGYNLTGITEPRCPECGTASSDATDDGRHT